MPARRGEQETIAAAAQDGRGRRQTGTTGAHNIAAQPLRYEDDMAARYADHEREYLDDITPGLDEFTSGQIHAARQKGHIR